jgi:hypothetical protein
VYEPHSKKEKLELSVYVFITFDKPFVPEYSSIFFGVLLYPGTFAPPTRIEGSCWGMDCC